MENCTKDIKGYKAKTEPIDSLSPYGSKYYGMAFIPEDEYCWPVCFCCKREMILILQLRVEDLPEIPADLTFEEGDMLQIFTCAYIDYDSDNYLNEHTNRQTVVDNQKCFQFKPNVNKNSPFWKEKYWHFTGKPARAFSDLYQAYCRENEYQKNYTPPFEKNVTFSPSHARGYRFTFRKTNTKNKKPLIFEELPWIESYHLARDNKGYFVDKNNSKLKINKNIADNRWVEDRCHFVNRIERQSLKIVGWDEVSFSCNKSLASHDIFNGCYQISDDESFDYLGTLEMAGYSFFERNELGRYPDCQYCNKPMSLFYSFNMQKMKERFLLPLYGLFYCQDHPDSMQFACIDECND